MNALLLRMSQSDTQMKSVPVLQVTCDRCGQEGHNDVLCRVRLDHSKRIMYDYLPSPKRTNHQVQVSTLVGTANEADVTIDGVRTKALLDTGSSVSTISYDF